MNDMPHTSQVGFFFNDFFFDGDATVLDGEEVEPLRGVDERR